MPFFYVRNSNFVALFKINENGEPVATVATTNTLSKLIKDRKTKCKLT